MNLTASQDGLSARRKIHRFQSRILNLFSLLIVATSFLVFSCREKTNGQSPEAKEQTGTINADSLEKPKVNIKVNKHYDDKGNVIGYDSTYTSFYSNIRGDSSRLDSLKTSFDNYFNRDYSSIFKNEFNSLFFNDSLKYPDFFHKDFFLKRYERNDHFFRDMMLRMDSIKNQFYRQHSLREKKKDAEDL